MQDSLHTRAPQLDLGLLCMLFGHLGWEKTDLTRSQTFGDHVVRPNKMKMAATG